MNFQLVCCRQSHQPIPQENRLETCKYQPQTVGLVCRKIAENKGNLEAFLDMLANLSVEQVQSQKT